MIENASGFRRCVSTGKETAGPSTTLRSGTHIPSFVPEILLSCPVQSFFRHLLETLHGEEQGVEKNREIQKDAAVLDIVQVILDRLMDDELTVAA